MTHLLVVVVVGVDVVVVLLVPHVLLIAQLAVEAGVSFLLQTEREKRRKDKVRVSKEKLTFCTDCL